MRGFDSCYPCILKIPKFYKKFKRTKFKLRTKLYTSNKFQKSKLKKLFSRVKRSRTTPYNYLFRVMEHPFKINEGFDPGTLNLNGLSSKTLQKKFNYTPHFIFHIFFNRLHNPTILSKSFMIYSSHTYFYTPDLFTIISKGLGKGINYVIPHQPPLLTRTQPNTHIFYKTSLMPRRILNTGTYNPKLSTVKSTFISNVLHNYMVYHSQLNHSNIVSQKAVVLRVVGHAWNLDKLFPLHTKMFRKYHDYLSPLLKQYVNHFEFNIESEIGSEKKMNRLMVNTTVNTTRNRLNRPILPFSIVVGNYKSLLKFNVLLTKIKYYLRKKTARYPISQFIRKVLFKQGQYYTRKGIKKYRVFLTPSRYYKVKFRQSKKLFRRYYKANIKNNVLMFLRRQLRKKKKTFRMYAKRSSDQFFYKITHTYYKAKNKKLKLDWLSNSIPYPIHDWESMSYNSWTSSKTQNPIPIQPKKNANLFNSMDSNSLFFKSTLTNIHVILITLTNPLLLKLYYVTNLTNYPITTNLIINKVLFLLKTFSDSKLHINWSSNITPNAVFFKNFYSHFAAIKLASKMREDVIPYYYHTLIRFMEHVTGKKALIQFYPFLNQNIPINDIVRYKQWMPRMRSFERRLGHKFFFEEALHIMHLAFTLKDAVIFSSWLKTMMLRISFFKTRSIFRFLRYIFLFYFSSIFNDLDIKGLKILLKGKISVKGKKRKRSILFRSGKTSYSQVNIRVAHHKQTVNTLTGVQGFQVWIFY